jgi:hypothetical protein
MMEWASILRPHSSYWQLSATNGPLISWTIPVLGVKGTFLVPAEWTFGLLIFLGFWNKKLGILGALGSCAPFIGTVTIMPFAPGA